MPTNSPCNSPILLVKKPNGQYRLVQDLRIVNLAVIPISPVVPNPYTLLSHIPPSTTHFSVLDLKDAFFTIPLHSDSYFLFAFTWRIPLLTRPSNSAGPSYPRDLETVPTYSARLWHKTSESANSPTICR